MPTDRRLDTIKHIAENRQRDIVVVIEDVHDPHNAAAIMRTCDALGIQDVYLIFETQEAYNPRNVGKSSSSSANKWLDFRTFESTTECIKELKKDGYTVIATALDDNPESLFEADLLEDKIALLIGNEHDGLTDTAITIADRIIYLPMRGMVQSLNVSVAAALFLYEITRQRRQSNTDFSLPNHDSQELFNRLKDR